MKKQKVTQNTILLELTHEEALMIASTFGDVAFASPFDSTFITRVGWTQEKVGEVAKVLRKILNDSDIVE